METPRSITPRTSVDREPSTRSKLPSCETLNRPFKPLLYNTSTKRIALIKRPRQPPLADVGSVGLSGNPPSVQALPSSHKLPNGDDEVNGDIWPSAASKSSRKRVNRIMSMGKPLPNLEAAMRHIHSEFQTGIGHQQRSWTSEHTLVSPLQRQLLAFQRLLPVPATTEQLFLCSINRNSVANQN